MHVSGLDVNKTVSGGWTALMDAACNGQTHFVRNLLEMPGIDLNKRDKWGRTALGLAMRDKQYEAAALLRAAGARE